MVRQFYYVAYGYNRFGNYFCCFELNTVLVVHADRFQAFFVAMQRFITQTVVPEKVFNDCNRFQNIKCFTVFFGLFEAESGIFYPLSCPYRTVLSNMFYQTLFPYLFPNSDKGTAFFFFSTKKVELFF
jgi:hypothetical protein